MRRRPQEELWCSVPTDWSGLLRPTLRARIEILSDEPNVTLDRVAYPLGSLAPSYRHLQRRHWREDAPFLLTDLHIDERLRSLISQEDLTTKTALRLINDLPGLEISDVQQTLTIGSADMDVSEHLSIPLNAPVAFVHRRALDKNGVAVLLAEGIYRGDVVRFDLKLK